MPDATEVIEEIRDNVSQFDEKIRNHPNLSIFEDHSADEGDLVPFVATEF